MVFKPESRDELKKAIDIYTENKEEGIENYGEINNWYVSEITDMSNLFEYKKKFNEDISLWDTSNVENMDEMFIGDPLVT